MSHTRMRMYVRSNRTMVKQSYDGLLCLPVYHYLYYIIRDMIIIISITIVIHIHIYTILFMCLSLPLLY